MEVGSCGVLDMSRVHPKPLFGHMFYLWWNCPLTVENIFGEERIRLLIIIKTFVTFLNHRTLR